MFRNTPSSKGKVFLSHGYTPSVNDVICGRGSNYKHPGNQVFIDAINSSLQDYLDASSRINKSVVVTTIVSNLFDCGMRFIDLDAEKNRYFVLSSERVLTKVGHSIRDQVKRHKKKEKQAEAIATTAADTISAPDANKDQKPKQNTDSQHLKEASDASNKESLNGGSSESEESNADSIFSSLSQSSSKHPMMGAKQILSFSDRRMSLDKLVDDNDFEKILTDLEKKDCDAFSRNHDCRKRIINSTGLGLLRDDQSIINYKHYRENDTKQEYDVSASQPSRNQFRREFTNMDDRIAKEDYGGSSPLPIDWTTHFDAEEIAKLSDILESLDNP